MKYRVRHLTQFDYEQKVSACYNRAHLLPRETPFQAANNSRIVIYPTPATGNRRIDYFGNRLYHFSIQEPHDTLSIQVTTEITLKQDRLDFGEQLGYGNTCAQVQDLLNNPNGNVETLYAREFLLNSPMINANESLKQYAVDCFSPDKPFLSAVMDLTHKIFEEFDFDPNVTNIATPLEEVLLHKHGVCQDFAHLAIGCLRSMGYAARYISGYLETLPPPGQEKLVGADASHAWFSVYSPGEGWFEFDPTNDSIPMYQHLVTAWGRDYSDVSPLRGVIFGGGQTQSLNVSVDVERFETNRKEDLIS
ncbi:MAG: transglutaminase family protein [Cellvibrionaceae bacterium]